MNQSTNKGAITIVMVEYSLIRMWIDGPAVSLQGSPTVSYKLIHNNKYPGHSSLVGFASLPIYSSCLDVFFGVVPSPATVVQE